MTGRCGAGVGDGSAGGAGKAVDAIALKIVALVNALCTVGTRVGSAFIGFGVEANHAWLTDVADINYDLPMASKAKGFV